MADDIRFEQANGWGIAVLDRPEALNALTLPMVRAMSARLDRWRDDDGVRGVLVKAVPGRAFCAGGDIRHVAEAARRGDLDEALAFFAAEYGMNGRIGAFPKPYVALIDGIVMGGGVGLSVHGSHRVMTENTLFAMPETGIGFFPDVGATYLLPRLKGRLGRYLGMTGARLRGGGAVAAGIGTHLVEGAALAEVEAALVDLGPGGVDEALARFARTPEPLAHREAIDRLFEGDDALSVARRLEADPGPFAVETLGTLREKSPLSVAATAALLARGARHGLAECLRLEYAAAARFLARGDFVEGVRALILDKDKRPRWRHARIEDVTPDEVEAMLAPLAGGPQAPELDPQAWGGGT